jgi:hypothetical protein
VKTYLYLNDIGALESDTLTLQVLSANPLCQHV